MIKSQRAITEFYALLLYADYSFLKMNKTLFRYHYEITILTLDKAEVKFREVFGLASYDGQLQDTPVQLKAPTGEPAAHIYVSQEFYERLRLERSDSSHLLANGYMVFLKKCKAWSPDLSDCLNDRLLLPEMESIRQFMARLENSLRLNRHGFIVFGELFAYIPSDNRIVRSGVSASLMVVHIRPYEFAEKDNYALKIWLNVENKIADYIELAIQAFLASFHIKNIRLRYLQLLMTLEVCFNRSSENSADSICRYVSILLAHDKSEFLSLYDEIMALWGIRNVILQVASSGDSFEQLQDHQLNLKTNRLEEVTRDVLKRMIKINPQNRVNLMDELKSKRLNK